MSAPKSHGRLSIRASARPRSLIESPAAGVWTARILTLYPEMFPGPLGASLIGRALAEGRWALATTSIRAFGIGRHRAVDDTPAGGGAGMVLRADVIDAALASVETGLPTTDWPVLALSPRGRRFDQAMAARLAAGRGVTLLCGRFEGIDQRVLDARRVEEVSLGDFILTGGEIAAMALIEASVRLIPRVLGNAASVDEESFSTGLLEYPHYTKPAEWDGRRVPPVLVSGDHAAVARWRRDAAERITRDRRPDLWRAHLARTGEAGQETRGGAPATPDAPPAGQTRQSPRGEEKDE